MSLPTRLGISATFACDSLAQPLVKWLEYTRVLSRLQLQWIEYGRLLPETPVDCVLIFIRNHDLKYPHPEMNDSLVGSSLYDMLEQFILMNPGTTVILVECPGPDTTYEELEYPQDVVVLRLCQLNLLYPAVFSTTMAYYNKESDLLIHQPYSSEALYALAAVATRQVYRAISSVLTKVIVLDCDNTLWGGVYSSQNGIDVSKESGYAKVHEFFLELANSSGIVLAIASKNSTNDMISAFKTLPSEYISWNDIVASRCNFGSKSQSICSIIEELGGLDPSSVIFVDDNVIEIEEVRHNFPVMTCPMVALSDTDPSDRFYAMLSHHWAFDQPIRYQGLVTQEDTNRSRMYQESLERENAFAESNASYEAFLASLSLKLDFEHLSLETSKADLQRASQLTMRTNQFNLHKTEIGLRKLREMLDDDSFDMFLVRATDRFGHYGAIGLIGIRNHRPYAVVETFLLSCRVLYRDIEYEMLSKVKSWACSQNCHFVRFHWQLTNRNRPAMMFTYQLPSVSSRTNFSANQESILDHITNSKENIEQFSHPLDNALDAQLAGMGIGSTGTIDILSHSEKLLRPRTESPPSQLSPSTSSFPSTSTADLLFDIAVNMRTPADMIARLGSPKLVQELPKSMDTLWSEMLSRQVDASLEWNCKFRRKVRHQAKVVLKKE